MTPPRSVLVIDGPSDTETVLRAVLERRGAQVHRARGDRVRVAWASATRPDVVVIDLDHAANETAGMSWGTTPQVWLSSHRMKVTDANARFLEKPFQFPELIRAVEDLLAASAPAA